MKATVLVTGATGFLGSHLVKALLKEDYRVIILKRSFSKTWHLDDVLSQLITYDLDLCELKQPFQDIDSIDAVIHTATCYGRHRERVSEIFQSNTAFPLKLLETAIAFQTETFINTDTMLDRQLNSYALSKHQFREWGEQLANQDKIRFVNIKLEHMFGPEDDDSKFTTYVVKSCCDQAPELTLTPGEQERDFIYIDDVVSAYSLLLKKARQQAEFYQEYELGSGKAVSIREFVETVHRLTDSQTVLNFGARSYREHEIMFSQADITKLKNLGWLPQYSLEKGLNTTIAAYAKSWR